jgi:hypothetical protein
METPSSTKMPVTTVFYLKPGRFYPTAKSRKGFWLHAHKIVLIHKDFISNIFFKSVHLVYQKLNETKSILDFAVLVGRF